MGVAWNMEDAKTPRYGYETEIRHWDWLSRHGQEQIKIKDEVQAMKNKYGSY